MKIVFKVKCVPEAGMLLAVSGDIPQLGGWDVKNSLLLQNKVANKWEGQAQNIPEAKKFEFKLIKLYPNDRTVWEELPDNLNRKFKMKEDVVVTMEWSNPKGQRKALRTPSYLKIQGLPSVIISGPVSKDRNTKDFDPFKDAEHSDSDREIILQKNSSIKIGVVYDRKEFQSLFYSNPKTQVTNSRSLRQLDCIHVISRKSPVQDKFSQEVQNYLKLFKGTIFWHYEGPDNILATSKNVKYKPILIASDQHDEKSIFEAYQRKFSEELIPHSIVLIIDLSLAQLKLQKSINGLLLGSLTKQQMIKLQKMNLESIKFVSFTHTKDTKLYLQLCDQLHSTPEYQQAHHHLQTKLSDKVHEQGNQAVDLLLFEMRQQFVDTMHGVYYIPPKANVSDINRIISQSSSSLFIIDLKVVEDNKSRKVIVDRLKDLTLHKGKLVIFFTWKTKQQLEKDDKDIINSKFFIVADDGREVRLNNVWIDVMERHRRNIEILSMKFKDYLAVHGGQQELHAYSLTYRNPNTQLIKKIGEQIKNMLLEQKYIKVSATDDLVKTSWRLNEGHTTLQAITQLRCMAEGSLNMIFVLIKDPKKDAVFRDMDNLNMEFPFFKENSQKLYIIQGMRESDRAQYYLEQADIDQINFGNI